MAISRGHVKPYFLACFLILCIGLWALPLSAEEKKTYRLTMAKDEPVHEMALAVLTEAYARLGLGIEVVHSPWRRSLAENDRGTYDGEIGRLKVIESITKNLIRVDEPLFDIHQYAYALAPIPHVNAWQDLKGMRIGIELGVVIVEVRTRGMNRVTSANKGELVMMLRRGAVDAIILEDVVDYTAEPYGFYQSPTALEASTLYHYLHKSHTDVAEALRLELLAMRRHGNIRKITGHFH